VSERGKNGQSIDFEEDLRGDGEAMNAKGGFGQAVLAGVIVAAASLVIHKATDSSDDEALATLTERVSHLSDQVRELNKQPYVRRDEYLGVLNGIENRSSGLETRVRDLERAELQRRQRDR
jgi:hypothetical protein